jgi:acyl-CoA reductase-like NAD-dependent aldehyde dehydrogenase
MTDEEPREVRGPWSSGRAEDVFDVDEPATGRQLARVHGGGAEQVDAAVRAARRAFDSDWRHRTARERGRLLLRAADVLREHADELAILETRDVGKPLGISRGYDLQVCADSFEFFGGLADKVPGGFVNLGPIDARIMAEPYGVVGGIIPFNWPPIHTAAKAAPALAAGNTVVLKPPEQAPLTIIRIVELLAELLPPDVLSVVPGSGPAAGAALAGHPLVGKLSFTGSPATARSVLATAAERLTPTLLELGGKCPIVVLADADLDAALRGAVEGAFFNQGEACTAASRLLVHRSVYDEVVGRFCAAVRRLRVGDGLDPATHVGPMITAAQRDRVEGYLKLGISEGATVAAQAALPDDERLRGGHYVAPTVFTDVRQDMRIVQEEIFGPVVTVQPFDDYEQAVALANGTDFGLVAAVYTADAVTANRAARDLDFGVVMVNNYSRAFLGSPFGGVKASGHGREHAVETLREFVWSKNVRVPSGLGPVPAWPAVDDVLEAR